MRFVRLCLILLAGAIVLGVTGASAMGERGRTTDIPGTVNVTTRTFQQEVIDHEGPILVFFTADWCP